VKTDLIYRDNATRYLNSQARAQNATAVRAIVSTPEAIMGPVRKAFILPQRRYRIVNLHLPALPAIAVAGAKIRLRAWLACGFPLVADHGESDNLFFKAW